MTCITPIVLSEPRLVLQHPHKDRWNTEELFRTPSDWFANEFPKATQKYGPPILEQHRLDQDGHLHVECLSINEDTFAGILAGEDRGTKLVYYLPEHEFYFFNGDLGYFTTTSKERLKLLLSQLFIQCATYMSKNNRFVDIGPLFRKFRSDEVLESILDRAKAMLGVAESFFSVTGGNRKDPVMLTGEQTAKLFVASGLEVKEGNNLKLGKAYEQYVYFCDLKKMEALPRNCFRKPTAAAVRDKFGIALRTDLKVDGKWSEAWKNVDTCLAAAS